MISNRSKSSMIATIIRKHQVRRVLTSEIPWELQCRVTWRTACSMKYRFISLLKFGCILELSCPLMGLVFLIFYFLTLVYCSYVVVLEDFFSWVTCMLCSNESVKNSDNYNHTFPYISKQIYIWISSLFLCKVEKIQMATAG